MLRKVEEAGIRGIRQKRKPYHIHETDFFKESETVRLLFSQLIHNPYPKRVVVIPSVSYGMANVVRNLPKRKGKILVCDGQFPSNVYPWKALEGVGYKMEVVKAPGKVRKGEQWNERILGLIDAETIAVAISHVHWADGTLFHLKEIRRKLDEFGGYLIVDGTQSVGALPFNVQEIRPDALVCAAYKWLMGPYAIGLAYYGEAFDGGVPVEESWMNRRYSEDFSGLLNYQDAYKELALRYEVGEHSNFILIPMLHAALKQVLRWQPDKVQHYCDKLMREPIRELEDLGYHLEESAYRSRHLFGIHCNDPAHIPLLQKSLKKHRVSVSFRGEVIRVAPHVYNDETDVRKLLKAMKEPIFAD